MKGGQTTATSKERLFLAFGWGVFLSINVYFLWGVPLPLLPDIDIASYDRLIDPFRWAASISIAVAVLVFAAISMVRLFDSKHSRSIRIGGAALCGGGYLAVSWVSAVAPTPYLFLIAGLLIGVSNGVFFLLWGEVFSSFDATSVMYVLFFAGIISGGICLILLFIKSVIAYIVLGMLLPVAAGSLWSALKTAHERQVKPYIETTIKGLRTYPWRPLICVTVLGFVFNAMREISFVDFNGPATINMFSLLGLVVVSVAVVGIMQITGAKKPDIERLYSPIMLVIAGCLIPVPFLDAQYRIVFIVLISCAYLFVVTLFKATCANNSKESLLHPFCVFGIGYTGVFGSVALGTWVGMVPREAGGENSTIYVIGIVLVAIYLLAIPLVLMKRRRKSSVIVAMDEDQLAFCCERVARRYAITQSEQAVMELLARNMSYASVAKELQLSENTVRTHGKAIYRKLDVHSKQELVDLVTAEQLHDS